LRFAARSSAQETAMTETAVAIADDDPMNACLESR
jgi:hypothetical protein